MAAPVHSLHVEVARDLDPPGRLSGGPGSLRKWGSHMLRRIVLLSICILLSGWAPAAWAGGDDWSETHMQSRHRGLLSTPLPRRDVSGATRYHQITDGPEAPVATEVPETIDSWTQIPWKHGVVFGYRNRRVEPGSAPAASRRGSNPGGSSLRAGSRGSQTRPGVNRRPGR